MLSHLFSNRKELLAYAVLFMLFAVFCNFFAYSFAMEEEGKIVFSFDASFYWVTFERLGSKFLTNPLNALNEIMMTSRNSDYNYSVLLFLLPWSVFFGHDRISLIMGIVNMLIILVGVSLVMLNGHILRKAGIQSARILHAFIALITLSFFPQFWIPVLNGVPLVFGLFFMSVILIMYFFVTPDEMTWKKILWMSFSFLILFILRRWFMYWIAGFFVAMFVDCGMRYWLEKEKRAQTKKFALRCLYMGLVLAALCWILLTPLMIRAITTNYDDIYAAFTVKGLTMMQGVKNIILQVGYVHSWICAGGLLAMLINASTRRFAIFLLIQWTVAYTMFFPQIYNPTHYYFLMLTMLLGCTFFISTIVHHARFRILQVLLVAVYLAFSIANFQWTFYPTFGNHPTYIKVLGASKGFGRHFYPRFRTDMEQFLEMVGALEKVTGPKDKIYFLVSSPTLNYSMVINSYLTFDREKNIGKQIMNTLDVDKRDGFPVRLFEASIVVGDPTAPLVPDEQQIAILPAQMLLNGTGIARSFEKVPGEFSLGKDTKVTIYRRVRNYYRSDVEELSNALMELYPDRPFVYEIPENLPNVSN